jgi:hypothetical protein
MKSRQAPPRPHISLPLADAEILLGPVTTYLIAAECEAKRTATDPTLTSDQKADAMTRYSDLAQAVLHLTTATRTTHRAWRESVADWRMEQEERPLA